MACQLWLRFLKRICGSLHAVWQLQWDYHLHLGIAHQASSLPPGAETKDSLRKVADGPVVKRWEFKEFAQRLIVAGTAVADFASAFLGLHQRYSG